MYATHSASFISGQMANLQARSRNLRWNTGCSSRGMKVSIKVAALVFVLFTSVSQAQARTVHTVRGAVLTSDGMMVDKFTVVAHPAVHNPVLVRRYKFTDGIFDLP